MLKLMAANKTQHCAAADKVAKILNSTSASFFTGLEQEDQSSILDVLADYFDDDCANDHDDKGNYIQII